MTTVTLGSTGDEELVPHPGKGRAQLLLAVGVGPGGVKEPDAALAGPADGDASTLDRSAPFAV